MNKPEKEYYFNKLKDHIGHSIEVVGYARAKDKSHVYPTDEEKDWEDISVECLDCNEVLIDFDRS